MRLTRRRRSVGRSVRSHPTRAVSVAPTTTWREKQREGGGSPLATKLSRLLLAPRENERIFRKEGERVRKRSLSQWGDSLVLFVGFLQ